MSKRICVIAAHPDDEVLGCGGTMSMHHDAGDEVQVLIMAEGLTSREDSRDAVRNRKALDELKNTAIRANSLLGVTNVEFGGFPDNRMDGCDRLDIVKTVEDYLARLQPDIIYTHFSSDLNVDHRRVHEAVITAVRPIPGQTVQSLRFFEVPSSTEWQMPDRASNFAPNWFQNISDSLGRKIEALNEYQCEMRDWPHARSIEAVTHLAHWRGATVGVEAAEAFVLGRQLIN